TSTFTNTCCSCSCSCSCSCRARSEQGADLAEQGLAHERNRRVPEPQERFVELPERERGALLFPVILAKLQNLQFPQRVVQVGRIRRPPLRLPLPVRPRLESFLHEELHSLLEAPLPGVHLDPDHEAGVAQERVLELPEPHL